MTSSQSTEMPTTRRRPTLPAGLALTGGAITFTSLYLAAGALTPLLVLYKEQWEFPAALLAAHQRAGVVAGIYIVSYIAFGVPIVIAGQLTDTLGLVPTVSWYTALTVLLALISLIAQIHIKHSARSVNGLARSSDLRTSSASMSEQDDTLPVSATPTTRIR